MFAWPFSGRKDRAQSIPLSVDSGYASMASSAGSGDLGDVSDDTSSSASSPACKPWKRIHKRVPQQQLNKLKGFKLTFGGPLIQHVRSKPPQQGQHQALHIDMKYIGECEQDAQLTIVISCHPAYEQLVKLFLRKKRVAIESFFHPSGSSTEQADQVHILVLPMSPTALAKILCQRPDRDRTDLQLVGERLSYQSGEGFHEATFGGFVGVCYEVGRWAVFGLTTSHQANWVSDEEGTYSVISHIGYLDRLLEEILYCSELEPFFDSVADLRSAIEQWFRFELEPVEGLQSGEYIENRRKYVTESRSILKGCESFVERIKTSNSDTRSNLEVLTDETSILSPLITNAKEYSNQVLLFLKRQGPRLGHPADNSALAKTRRDEESWKAATRANFNTVREKWREVHDSVMSDDLTGAGDVVAQSIDGPISEDFANLDWALIRIPELDKEMAAAVASPGANKLSPKQMDELEFHDEEHAEQLMLVNMRRQFPNMECVGELSYICIPPSRNFVEAIKLPAECLNTDLGKGDSGSWIVDKETGQVLGHLVAIDSFGDALLIPIASILEDIKAKLNVQKVSLPREPLAMAIADKLENLGQKSNEEGQDSAAESQFITTPLVNDLAHGLGIDLASMERWRYEMKCKWAFQKRTWEISTGDCGILLQYYRRERDRLGQDKLAAIVGYQWPVQDGYHRKTLEDQQKAIEDQKEEDMVKWSEQRARWAYQDQLFAKGNEHWDNDWWTLYIRQWEEDIRAWQASNSRLSGQVRPLRQCKELLDFHRRRHPKDWNGHSSGSLRHDDVLLSNPSSQRSSVSRSNDRARSRRALLSLGTPDPLSSISGSVESGYISASPPISTSSYGSSQSPISSSGRLPLHCGLISSAVSSLRATSVHWAREGAEDEDIFHLSEE